MTEEWKPIPGFDDCYEASSAGSIRRTKDGGGQGGWKTGYVLSQSRSKQGYKRVNLWTGERQRGFYVHRLIAMAFLGNAPTGRRTVNHRNGRQDDNRVENLEWASHSENYRHALTELGFQPPRGDEHWHAKKNPDLIREIRARAKAGESQSSIARNLKGPQGNVSLIVNRKSWAHIT